jgi:hypothetical protein
MRRREASRRAPPPPLCALHLTRVVHRCAVLLMVLLLPYAGPRWAVIAQSLSGRTDDAVRNRYLRLSKKNGDLSQRDSLKKGDMWTTAEDDLINDGVQRYGQKWHVIADFLPGRSANAVRNRYLRQTAKQEGGASASHHPVATTQVVAPALVVAPTELAEDPSVAAMQVEATHLVHASDAMVAASEIATAAAEVATAAAEVAEVAAATAELAAPE